MAKKWKLRSFDPASAADLASAAKVPLVVAQLLVARNITAPDEVQHFLEARLTGLRDPNQLPGLAAAAEIIHAAITADEPITIYGDYDADGMTSTAILLRALRLLRAQVDFYIPNRVDEGYGVNCAALRKIAERGSKLVITVDCGITSVAEAELARELGLQLIITDHHAMGENLPAADAIVHPQLPDHDYPFAGLCGAGVAFKLAWELCKRASGNERVSTAYRDFLMQAIGICAIGTIADVVPLQDENRLIVRHGLVALKDRPFVGITAMAKSTKLDQRSKLTSEDVAFMLAPRLYAAGRLGQAELGVELLSTNDAERAEALAVYLNELNDSRTSIERSIYLSASKQIKEKYDREQDAAFVLADRGWHPGVIGIVAGRLAEKYARPVIMIALDELGGAVGTGSARSALGLDLHGTLSECSEKLEGFGGHKAAAGLRINTANLDDFRQIFCERVHDRIPTEDRVAEIAIDAESPLAQLTLRTVGQIEQLAPFGEENPRPLLCATGVTVFGQPKKMGGGQRHLSLQVTHHNVTMRALAFGQAEWADELEELDGPIDIVYRPVINEFRGRRNVEIHLVDWRVSNLTAPTTPHLATKRPAKLPF